MKKVVRIMCHILWLFVIGGIIGYIVETSWHMIKYGTYINKQGLWYGPFKPIYGSGLIIITLLFYKFKDKKWYVIFTLGAVVGLLFEYMMSYLQEFLFHSYFWTYSGSPLNLHGRIYLPYALFWGLLVLVWIKFGYKHYQKWFDALYSKKFTTISIILFVLMLYNVCLTTFIMDRYTKRLRDIPAENKFEEYLDQKYPNEDVKKKLPKLRVHKDS